MIVLLSFAFAQDLAVSGVCPGPVDLEATNLTPGGTVALLTGRDVGNDVVPAGPCAGLASDLTGLTFRGLYTANAGGDLLLGPTLGAGACGAAVQMVDVSTCTLTNVDFVPEPALSYAADIEPFLAPSCGGCHGGSGGFTLSYNNLLANSIDVPAMPRIDPGVPDNSYVWHKLQGTQGSVGGAGSRMPLGGPLSQLELDLIEQWILDGAQP